MNPGRNDPCSCGSGKKFIDCCLGKAVLNLPRASAPTSDEINQLDALFNAGGYAELESRARSLIELYPDSGVAWKLLGISLHMQGKDFLFALQKTASLLPDDAGVHNNLGNALHDLGQLVGAEAAYRRAVELKPDFVIAHDNLGNVLKDLGQLDAAAESHRRALHIKHKLAEDHNTRGVALLKQGQLDGAAASFRQALQFKPDYARAYNNLGVALLGLEQFDGAEAGFRRALQLNPDSVQVHSNLGNVQRLLGQLDDAVESCRRALEIKPDFAEAHANLGNALKEIGRLDDAVSSYRRALEIKPEFIEAYSNMLYLHAFSRDISPELERNIAANWENIVLNESERTTAHNRVFDYLPRTGRKLKVGIVSAELGQHAVAEFLEPILEQLDRSRVHATLFPTVARTETRAAKFKGLADEYISLVGMPDHKAADLIRANQIDILIDTTSHMRGCRLGIFARRAAPVQCHYIGYHGTTGLAEMDWFIADNELLPPGYDTHFREGIWRLSRLWISYKGDASLPDSRWEPSPDGTVWLGSFNNLTKVREETLALWVKVLNAIPESRLLLKDRHATDAAVQDRIRTELGSRGISGERVEFAGQVTDWRSHMTMYDRLDIALDTIPLNSGTTAFDALWMGVPLVALEDNWMGGRMSSTILRTLGRPEWVAQNEDEYVAKVAALARDVKGRKSLRAAQRAQMAASPLCDTKELTRVLEDAFERMFDHWMEDRESARKESGRK